MIPEYRIRTESGLHPFKSLPWPLEGDAEGSGNDVENVKPDGTERYSFVSGLNVTTDGVTRVVTASGAGYGDPAKRDADAVRADIENGFITADRTKAVHCGDAQ